MGKKKKKKGGRPGSSARDSLLEKAADAVGPSRTVRALERRRKESKRRLEKREDPFAQLLSRGYQSQIVGDAVRVKGRADSADSHGLLKLAPSKSREYLNSLQERVGVLRTLLKDLHPLGVLARVANANVVGAWGEYFEPEAKGSEARVELVAGLLLTQFCNSGVSDPPPAEEVQRVFDELDEISDLSLLANIAQGLADGGILDPTADVRVRSRMYALHVRGDSYVQHARDLAKAIYGPLSGWMHSNLGYDIEDLIGVTQTIVQLMETRVNQLGQDVRDLLEGAEEFARSSEAPADMRDALKRWGPKAFREHLLVMFFEQHMTEVMSFTTEDLVDDASLPPERVSRILERFSAEVGSVGESEYNSPLDTSPLLVTPILRYGGRYMLPVPGMMARDLPRLLEKDLLDQKANFSRHRASVLDDLAISYIGAVLLGSRSFVRLQYEFQQDGKIEHGELDGLILFDRVAIIVEGKATPLSPQSRRGDVNRLIRDMERAVEEAWEQGVRARTHLRSGSATFTDKRGNVVVTVPAQSIDKIFIVNPTLHSLADQALQLPRLRDLGLFNQAEFPWSVFINDLRIVTETVRNAAEFLHYLEWRSRLPLGERVTAIDELDVFGSYLLREQVEDRLRHENSSVHLHSSVDFDTFYMGEEGDGPPAERPKMFSVPLVDRFLERLSRQRPSAWLSAAGVVLDLSLAQLAAVDVSTGKILPGIHPTEVRVAEIESVVVVAIGTMRRWEEAYAEVEQDLSEDHRVVLLTLDYANQPRILWAIRRTDSSQS